MSFAAIVLSALLLPSASYAQTGKSPGIEKQSSRLKAFVSALEEIAIRSQLCLVVEGEPLPPAETTLKGINLKDSKGTSALTKIRTLAEAYDYDVEQAAGAVYVLRKRYTNPSDLPDITLGECRAVVDNVLKLLQPFGPVGLEPGEPRLKRFEASLTQEQALALADPDSGLSVRNMTSQQRSLVWNVPMSMFIRKPEQKVLQIKAQLECVTGSDATIGWGVSRLTEAGRLFGYRGDLRYRGTLQTPNRPWINHFRPLSNPDVVTGNTDGSVGMRLNIADQGADRTNPIPLKGNNSPPENVAVPLRSAIASLAAAKSVSLNVDDELADKRILILNEQAAAAPSVLRGIASAYDLTVRADPKTGALRLTRPPARRAAKLQELPEALRLSLPCPFLRALHWKDHQEEMRQADQHASLLRQKIAQITSSASTNKREDEATRRQFFEMGRELWKSMDKKSLLAQSMDSEKELRIAAIRRLRTLVEPSLKPPSLDQIPVQDVTPSARMALAMVLLTDLWPAIQRPLSTTTLPPYITRFDEAVLTGGRSDVKAPVRPGDEETTQSGFSLSFEYRKEDGTLGSLGIGITEFYPHH